MDYGVMLKAANPNPGRQSAHHVKQSKFDGSDRQIRGAVLKVLTGTSEMSETQLITELGGKKERCIRIIDQLVSEGFVIRINGTVSLK